MEKNEEQKSEVTKALSIVVLALVFLLSIGGGLLSYKLRHSGFGNANAVNTQETGATKKPSDYKIGIPYEDAKKDSKPALVLFYADWCHFCIEFMPKYETLFNKFNSDMNFVKINVEDPKYKNVVEENGIAGFPTVILMNFKNGNKNTLSNSIFSDMEKLEGQLADFIKISK